MHFSAEAPEAAGYNAPRGGRRGAHYMGVLRGWTHQRRQPRRRRAERLGGIALWPDPRFHGEAVARLLGAGLPPLSEMRAAGIWHPRAGSPADLVYSYCQYELARAWPADALLTLYRGVNRMDDFEQLGGDARRPRRCC